MSVCASQTESASEVRPTGRDAFGEQVKALKDAPFVWSVYPAAQKLWSLWTSDENADGSSWLVFISPQLKLASLAVALEEAPPGDRPYYVIDETIPRDQTMVFELTARNISFGVTPRPCFWGLYTYLRRIRAEIIAR